MAKTTYNKDVVEARRKAGEVLARLQESIEPSLKKLFEAGLAPLEEYDRADRGEQIGRPPLIPIPKGDRWSAAQWDNLFDWYHTYGKPKGMTLKKFTEQIQRQDKTPVYGTVKNRHSEYLAEHGKSDQRVTDRSL